MPPSESSPPRPPQTDRERAIVAWALLGVIGILGQAVFRLAPLALEPILDGSLGPLGVLAYVGAIAFMAYSEGYRGFQKGFCPRVIVRAFALAQRGGWPVIVAPLMAMGLVYGSRRRLITSWVLVSGIVGLIMLVRQLPQPWRGAVDAGVIVGLSWGIIALVIMALGALRGQVPAVDPDLPN